MNNVLDLLVKAGYEASTIGNDVLPCTLRKSGEPIGFLLEDMSVKLLPDREVDRKRLESVISFAVENQGLDTVQDEYKLSRYRNIILTATYDFDSGHPVYNIYSQEKDQDLLLLNSVGDLDAAKRDYISRSGLAQEDLPDQAKQVDRLGKFIDAIKARGYSLKENREEAHRAYDITNKDGHVVGYIGKNNRVTITTENSKTKHFLSGAYIDTNPEQVMLPSFFEKLKDRLKEIGLALKVIFTGKGQHYAIHNEQQQEIATVNERHEVTYTDRAKAEQKAKIDALVDEIRRENQERQGPEKEATQEAPERQVEPAHTEAIKAAPVFTPTEMQRLTEAVLADTALTNSLFGMILSNPDFLSRLNADLAEKLQKLNTAAERTTSAKSQSHEAEQGVKSKADVKISQYSPEEKEEIINLVERIRDSGHGDTLSDQNVALYNAIISEKEAHQKTVPANSDVERPRADAAQAKNGPRQLNAEEIRLSQEFDKYVNLLQTLDGFNEQKQQAVMAEMVARFGTTDPNQFIADLNDGKFSQESTLSERLKTSQKIADLQNAKATPEPAKEKERA